MIFISSRIILAHYFGLNSLMLLIVLQGFSLVFKDIWFGLFNIQKYKIIEYFINITTCKISLIKILHDLELQWSTFEVDQKSYSKLF